MNSWDAIKLVKFVYGVDVSSSSEVDILGQSSRYDLLCGTAHNLLQTGVDNILLSGTFQKQLPVKFIIFDSSSLLNDI